MIGLIAGAFLSDETELFHAALDGAVRGVFDAHESGIFFGHGIAGYFAEARKVAESGESAAGHEVRLRELFDEDYFGGGLRCVVFEQLRVVEFVAFFVFNVEEEVFGIEAVLQCVLRALTQRRKVGQRLCRNLRADKGAGGRKTTEKEHVTVWSVFPGNTRYFEPS